MFKNFFYLVAVAGFILPLFYKDIEPWSLFKRSALAISILLVLFFISIILHTYTKWIKYIQKISSKLAYFLYLLIFHPIARTIYLSIILAAIVMITWYNPFVTGLAALAFMIFFASIKQFPLQMYREVIFEDDLVSNNNGWQPYWGTVNPDKTIRFENSMIVFEATEDEIFHEGKEYGTYIDLKNGIEEGGIYEVSCRVKSDPGTTMKFQLWLHDNVIGNNSSMRTTKYPDPMETPDKEFKEIKARFIATVTKGIRVHLHNKGGLGKILVDRVVVSRINM